MIEPKEIEIDGVNYTITKFPAVIGREIITKYPVSALPKLGDYAVNQETMLKLMGHVYITVGEKSIALSTIALVNNHVASWETLLKIEAAMIEYNCSFFQNGLALTFCEGLAQKAQAWILKILTGLSEQSSQIIKPPSEN